MSQQSAILAKQYLQIEELLQTKKPEGKEWLDLIMKQNQIGKNLCDRIESGRPISKQNLKRLVGEKVGPKIIAG